MVKLIHKSRCGVDTDLGTFKDDKDELLKIAHKQHRDEQRKFYSGLGTIQMMYLEHEPYAYFLEDVK